MIYQNPIVFIINKNNSVNSVLAGIFWFKGFEPFKFKYGKDCLTKFKELNGKVDTIIMDNQTALDNDILLIGNIKKMNPNTKVLVISNEYNEKNKIKFEKDGADEILSIPLSPIDIANKVLLMVPKYKLLENQKNFV